MFGSQTGRERLVPTPSPPLKKDSEESLKARGRRLKRGEKQGIEKKKCTRARAVWFLRVMGFLWERNSLSC